MRCTCPASGSKDPDRRMSAARPLEQGIGAGTAPAARPLERGIGAGTAPVVRPLRQDIGAGALPAVRPLGGHG